MGEGVTILKNWNISLLKEAWLTLSYLNGCFVFIPASEAPEKANILMKDENVVCFRYSSLETFIELIY